MKSINKEKRDLHLPQQFLSSNLVGDASNNVSTSFSVKENFDSMKLFFEFRDYL